MKGLYLRTVFWFGLLAGGSVGHTAGVINAFHKYIELDVVSNDRLAGVKSAIRIIKPCIPFFGWLPSNLKELMYSFKLIFKLNKRLHYDFLYQRYSGNSFAGAYLAKKNKILFLLEFNSSDAWKLEHWNTNSQSFIVNILKSLYRKYISLPIVRKIENYNLNCADYIVVVSKVLKENLLSIGVNPNKIIVNPNGVNPDVFAPSNDGKKIREKYRLHEYVVVGFVGTFGQWHGVLELAKAICYFYTNNLDLQEKVRFLLVGEGVLLEKTRKIVDESDFTDKVIFTGMVPQQEAPYYLDACDILLSPHIPNSDGTKFFGSPTKLFEYMAMGKGIIASNLEQIGQMLTHNETALLTEPGNVSQIAECIRVLVENEGFRKKLGVNARKEVLEHYTWDQHVERILKRLHEV